MKQVAILAIFACTTIALFHLAQVILGVIGLVIMAVYVRSM